MDEIKCAGTFFFITVSQFNLDCAFCRAITLCCQEQGQARSKQSLLYWHNISWLLVAVPGSSKVRRQIPAIAQVSVSWCSLCLWWPKQIHCSLLNVPSQNVSHISLLWLLIERFNQPCSRHLLSVFFFHSDFYILNVVNIRRTVTVFLLHTEQRKRLCHCKLAVGDEK